VLFLFPRRFSSIAKSTRPIARACGPVIETLENRRLLSGGLTPDRAQLYFNDTIASGSSPGVKVLLTNTTASSLSLAGNGLSLTGADAARFSITGTSSSLPDTLAPGQSLTVTLAFTANTVGAISTANLHVVTSDSSALDVSLRGLGTAGQGGANEPSLQRIMDLYQIPISVGDSNPSDVYLDNPPAQPNDEVVMQELLRAASGNVTLTPIADFGVGSASVPQVRFGFYTPGNQYDRTELLTLMGSGNTTQTVNPSVSGLTSFDPGSSAFGVYGQFPSMYPTVVSTPGGTQAFSEDALNSAYDPASPRKVRFYTYKTPDGTVVPNTYVMALEDYSAGYDTQDFVAIISNVKPAVSGPEIGFENLDGAPSSTRLVFNRIQVQPPAPENANGLPNYQPPNNIVHDVAKLRIRNSGTSSLVINSLVLSDTNSWQIISPPSTPVTIASGGSLDLSVRFIAQSGGQINGTLTINSNDADEPASTIQLAGWWQNVSEGNVEPSLQTILNTFGYGTKVTYAGQSLNNGGKVMRVGDEVLSPYWNVFDPTLSVGVRQIDAFHTQGNIAQLKWFLQGASGTKLFTSDGDEGQSFLPHINNSTVGVVGASYAAGTFAPSGPFGFMIDQESSVDNDNVQEQSGGGYGHHVRFFVAKDSAGRIIPNTYIMTMDYSGINYDYQDNVYVITNMKPVSPPGQPTALTALGSTGGVQLDWADNTEANLGGYNVYRSESDSGPWTKINAAVLTSSSFDDTGAPSGATSYYQITAVDLSGGESSAAAVSAARPDGPPSPPPPPPPPPPPSATFANGNWNDIVYDSQGVLHFAWYDTAAKTVKYATQNTAGVWSSAQTIDTSGDDVGGWLSIAIDSHNNPAVAYFDGSAGDLRYASLSGGSWDVQPVDWKNSVGLFPSLKFDTSDHPIIAYYKKTTGDLRVAQNSGAGWSIQDIGNTTDNVGRSASLARQSNGLWAVAYENSTSGLLQYAYQSSASHWINNVVDTSTAGMSYISLAYDTSGRASISYQETGRGDLKFALLKKGRWTTDTIASKGAVGMYSKLVFAADGYANIFYYSKQLNTLMEARGYLGNWDLSLLKNDGGRFISADLAPGGHITYSWLDSASETLQFDVL
jgi:hypothetical protein